MPISIRRGPYLSLQAVSLWCRLPYPASSQRSRKEGMLLGFIYLILGFLNARLSGLSLVFPKCHPKSCLTMDILAKRLASNSLPVFPGCHDTIRVLISARSLTFLASARSALRWRRTAAARALRASLRAWSLVARSASSCAARSCSAWATLA